MWSEIGIVGLSTVLDEKTRKVRRIVWFLLIIGAYGFLGYHWYDRIDAYITRRVLSSTSYVDRKTLALPHITLCFASRFVSRQNLSLDFQALADASSVMSYTLVGDDFYNVSEFWQPCIDVTRPSVCYISRDNPEIYPGQMAGLLVTLASSRAQGLSNHIQGAVSYILTPPGEAACTLLPHGEIRHLYFGQENSIRLSSKIHKKIPESTCRTDGTLPITSSLTYTQRRCQIECLLMRISEAADDANASCTADRQTLTSMTFQSHLFNISYIWNYANSIYACRDKKSPAALSRPCRCPGDCHQQTYEVEAAHAKVEPDPDMKMFASDDTTIAFGFKSVSVAITTDFWSYTYLTLLADLGGAAGLFLGASLYTFVQMFEAAVAHTYFIAITKKQTISPIKQ